MSYTVKIQIAGPGCDLVFSHMCDSGDVAAYAKQFAAIVAGDPSPSGIADAGTLTGLGGPYTKKSVGAKVRATAFECPSVVFGRASREGAKQRMETEIGASAPKVGQGVSEYDAIFGGDEEYDFDSENMQLGGGPIGRYGGRR